MNTTLIILAMAAGVYALRIVGFLTGSITVPERWEQSFQFVPISLLSALVTLNLTSGDSTDPVRLIAATAGGLAAWRTRKMWACIAAGMVVYWAFDLFT